MDRMRLRTDEPDVFDCNGDETLTTMTLTPYQQRVGPGRVVTALSRGQVLCGSTSNAMGQDAHGPKSRGLGYRQQPCLTSGRWTPRRHRAMRSRRLALSQPRLA